MLARDAYFRSVLAVFCLLREPFGDLVGHPITREAVTNPLLTVRDCPGLRSGDRKVKITLLPGKALGGSDLELEAFEDRYAAKRIVSADTTGSGHSGEYRTRADPI